MLNRKKGKADPAEETAAQTAAQTEETADEFEDIPEEVAEETAEETAAEPEVDPVAEELEKTKENYLRLAAEYDNYRKRTQREKESITSDVKAATVAQLLPIIDNIERALSFDEADEADIRKGIEMVRQQAVSIFDKLGITPFCEPGDTFDPNKHNCIGMANVEGFESGQITLVIQRGYMLGDKVVRTAMVQVAE